MIVELISRELIRTQLAYSQQQETSRVAAAPAFGQEPVDVVGFVLHEHGHRPLIERILAESGPVGRQQFFGVFTIQIPELSPPFRGAVS